MDSVLLHVHVNSDRNGNLGHCVYLSSFSLIVYLYSEYVFIGAVL